MDGCVVESSMEMLLERHESFFGNRVRHRSSRCLRSVLDAGRGLWWCLVVKEDMSMICRLLMI